MMRDGLVRFFPVVAELTENVYFAETVTAETSDEIRRGYWVNKPSSREPSM